MQMGMRTVESWHPQLVRLVAYFPSWQRLNWKKALVLDSQSQLALDGHVAFLRMYMLLMTKKWQQLPDTS